MSKQTVVRSTRIPVQDALLVDALAAAEGATVCATMSRYLVPVVRQRLSELASQHAEQAA